MIMPSVRSRVLLYRLLLASQVGLLLFIVIATAIGLSGKLVQLRDDADVFVTFWHTRDGFTVATPDLPCATLRHRLLGGCGVSVTAAVLQGLLLLCAGYEVATVPSLMLSAAKYALHGLSLVFGLVAWALGAALQHSDWCGFVPRSNGYGFCLLVSAWCVQLVLLTAAVVAGDFIGRPFADRALRRGPGKAVWADDSCDDDGGEASGGGGGGYPHNSAANVLAKRPSTHATAPDRHADPSAFVFE